MKWPVAPDWPHAAQSKRIFSHPHRWHVQIIGQGPLVICIHGAGGSTHSMAPVMSALVPHYRVVAVDLPGHGYSQLGARHRSGLDQMSADLHALCQQEGWHPDAIIGHSAGCAVALRLSETLLSPRGQVPKVVGINAALSQFTGIAGVLFPALAKALASLPFTASLFAGIAGNKLRVSSLISSTGSELTQSQLDQYTRLVGDKDHVDGALLMMSQWKLDRLLSDLPKLEASTLLITGAEDQTVPEDVSAKAAQKLSNAKHISLPDLGHLAHEEDPKLVAKTILTFLDQTDS